MEATSTSTPPFTVSASMPTPWVRSLRSTGLLPASPIQTAMRAVLSVIRRVPITTHLESDRDLHQGHAPAGLSAVEHHVPIDGADVQLVRPSSNDPYDTDFDRHAVSRGLSEIDAVEAERAHIERELLIEAAARAAAEAGRLAGELAATDETIAWLESGLQRDVMAGEALPPLTASGPPLGARLHAALARVTFGLFVAGVLGTEGFLNAMTCWDWIGVDVQNLAVDWNRDPFLVGMGFALGQTVTVLLFVLSCFGIDMLAQHRGELGRPRRGLPMLLGIGALAAVLVISALLGLMREDFGRTAAPAGESGIAQTTDLGAHNFIMPAAMILVTALLPIGLALFHVRHRTRRERAAAAGRSALAVRLEKVARWEAWDTALRPWRAKHDALRSALDAARQTQVDATEAAHRAPHEAARRKADRRTALRHELAADTRGRELYLNEVVAAMGRARYWFQLAAGLRNRHLLTRDAVRQTPPPQPA